jgi:hypothetical protein
MGIAYFSNNGPSFNPFTLVYQIFPVVSIDGCIFVLVLNNDEVTVTREFIGKNDFPGISSFNRCS